MRIRAFAASARAVGLSLLLCFACSAIWADEEETSPTYTPEQIKAGASLYARNCATCHGSQGNQISGVDLLRGHYILTSLTEEGVKQTIEKGFRRMPALNLTDTEATEVMGYLHDMQFKLRTAPPLGDAARGKLLIEQSKCLECHRIGQEGSYTGPNLTGIFERGRSVADVTNAILNPDALVPPEDRYVRLITADGKIITGRLLNRDAFTVELIDSEQRLRCISTSGLREYSIVTKGLMPSYAGKLTSQDMTDILNYLAFVKGTR